MLLNTWVAYAVLKCIFSIIFDLENISVSCH
jgi:hypothetical protein